MLTTGNNSGYKGVSRNNGAKCLKSGYCAVYWQVGSRLQPCVPSPGCNLLIYLLI